VATFEKICLIIRGGSHAATVLGSFVFITRLEAYMDTFKINGNV
jgi:hypothetical protein